MPRSTPPAQRSSAPAPGQDVLALERQVCFALSVASRTVLTVYRPLLEPMGLTHPQYLVMLALWQHAPMAVKDVGALLELDSGTLSPLLKRLEAAGLVTRTRAESDERVVTVDLTADGRALRRQAERVPEQVVARLGIEVADLEGLHAMLSRVIAAAR